MKHLNYLQPTSEDIKRYKLLCSELQRLAAFEDMLDADAIGQMKAEKLMLQQFINQ